MKIQAAVVTRAGQPFEIKTLKLAPPAEGEVLVRVQAAGICHSDWNVRTGATEHPLPAVAGHEGAGIVESTGPVVTEQPIMAAISRGTLGSIGTQLASGTTAWSAKQARPQ